MDERAVSARCRRDDDNDLALIGEIERIEPEDFAKAFDFFS